MRVNHETTVRDSRTCMIILDFRQIVDYVQVNNLQFCMYQVVVYAPARPTSSCGSPLSRWARWASSSEETKTLVINLN